MLKSVASCPSRALNSARGRKLADLYFIQTVVCDREGWD